jgi:membrane protease YdiL (CAAX protease family)
LVGLDTGLPGPKATEAIAEVALWKRLLAGLFYGGINEELLLRLFLVSLIAWTFARGWRRRPVLAGPAVMGAAILIAAVLFGLGHLPAAAMVGELTPQTVTRVLALNTLAGVVFGGLYWRRGLDAAMVAHAAAHLPLQLLATAL